MPNACITVIYTPIPENPYLLWPLFENILEEQTHVVLLLQVIQVIICQEIEWEQKVLITMNELHVHVQFHQDIMLKNVEMKWKYTLIAEGKTTNIPGYNESKVLKKLFKYRG